MTAVLQIGPALWVDAPAPQPRPYRLVDLQGALREGVDEHWLNGITIDRYNVGLAGLTVDNCRNPSTIQFTNPVGDYPAPGPVHPAFGVVLGISCNGQATTWEDEYERRAKVAFEAVESQAVELEFVRGGLFGGEEALVNTAAVVDATAANVGIALAELENRFAARFGHQGVLHISPRTGLLMSSHNMLQPNPRPLTSVIGTPIVIGAGYAGDSGTDWGMDPPTGQSNSATTEWAYMTGPVAVYRTDVEPIGTDAHDELDRSTNTYTLYLRRYYALAWDPNEVLAVKIDRST